MTTTAHCARCTQRPARTRGMCHRCYEFTRTRYQAYGRWESSYVDAEPARQHVLAMRAAGVGRRRLAKIAGVSENVINGLVNGRPYRGDPPRRQIARRCADAILAVPLPSQAVELVADSALVPAVGATRRVRALVAAGYPLAQQTDLLGLSRSTVTVLARGDELAKASTVRAVRVLFDRLQLVPGPSTRARRHAEREGWPMPLDWDEDSIDDPDATVERSSSSPAARRRDALDRLAERREQVARLTALNMSAEEIAARTGVTARTVERDRRELGQVAS